MAVIHKTSLVIAAVALSVFPSGVLVASHRSLSAVDDPAAHHYWVGPLIDKPIGKACYRRACRGKPCPRGYDWDGLLSCWAQCPLEYPVECGAECLPHNRACTKAILDKVGSVVSTAANTVSGGMFIQLTATSEVVKRGLTCTHKMLPVVMHIAEFVAASAETRSRVDAQLRKVLSEQDFVTRDLPIAVAVCLGRDPPSSAGPSLKIAHTMQLILDKVIALRDQGENVLGDGSFLDFLNTVGLSFGGGQRRRLRSMLGWNDAKRFVDAGISSDRTIKGVVENITEIVAELKHADGSSTLQTIRYNVMNSDVFLRDLPDAVLGCMDASDPASLRKRDQILKTVYTIVDQVLDAAVTPSGRPRSLSNFLVAVADLGLDALSSFDLTGLASLAKEFVQPICGPSISPRTIDDGPADQALGLQTVETAFTSSSGHHRGRFSDHREREHS